MLLYKKLLLMTFGTTLVIQNDFKDSLVKKCHSSSFLGRITTRSDYCVPSGTKVFNIVFYFPIVSWWKGHYGP